MAAAPSSDLVEVLAQLGWLDPAQFALISSSGIWLSGHVIAQQLGVEDGVLELMIVEKTDTLEKQLQFKEVTVPLVVLQTASLTLLLEYAKIVSSHVLLSPPSIPLPSPISPLPLLSSQSPLPFLFPIFPIPLSPLSPLPSSSYPLFDISHILLVDPSLFEVYDETGECSIVDTASFADLEGPFVSLRPL